MTKILSLLFLIILLLSPNKVNAVDIFTKYAQNPLTFTGSFPGWNEYGRLQPQVIYDGQQYKMWYSSFNGQHFKVAHATSSDGINWTRDTLYSLIDTYENHDPSPLITPNGMTLYFAGDQGGGHYRIFKVNMIDDTHPDLSTLKTIMTPQGGWEVGGISAQFAYYKDQTYYLFFGGQNGSGVWNIGLATSQDGENWSRCQNNPILTGVDGAFLYELNNKYYLFFHNQDHTGIGVAETNDSLSCNANWTNKQQILTPGSTYDQRHMTGPAIVSKDGKLNMYYSGLGNDVVWRINLASANLSDIPSPISTPTPTSLPQPTPTPTAIPKTPTVIIPGMLASWNKDAILHNEATSQDNWKLLPFVKEYDGLINSLDNLGYKKDKDYYFFTYDWRNKLENSASDLDGFIQNKILNSSPSAKINIIGHSLGGLVGRIWAQKFNMQSSIKNLVTVGTPHKGVAQAYKPVEGGEIDRENSLLWLAEKLILTLNKNGIETDKQTIARIFPVLKDLFPIFPFLKKNNQYIDNSVLTIQNDTLNHFANSISTIFTPLKAIAGEKGDTLSGFEIISRSPIDQLLDLYPDGKPFAKLSDTGDFVVTSQSAKEGNKIKVLSTDHGQVVYSKEAINEILNDLGIPHLNSQIIEGQGTKITPSLIFLIKSPATIDVVDPTGKTFQENDGIVFIENATEGNYILRVVGHELGEYNILVGEINSISDSWNKIKGEISLNPTQGQTDTYEISFTPNDLQEFFIDQNNISSLFDNLITELTILNNKLTNHHLAKASNYLSEAKKFNTGNELENVAKLLLKSQNEIFLGWDDNYDFEELKELISKLENIYQKCLGNTINNQSDQTKELGKYEAGLNKLQNRLIQDKNRNRNVLVDTNFLKLAFEKLEKSKKAFADNDLQYFQILMDSVKEIIKKINNV